MRWKRRFILLLSFALYLGMPGNPFQAEKVLSGNANQGTIMNRGNAMILVKARKIYYETNIKQIIRNDCGRCHSGATRNLMDYDNLKAYADSGMLATMVQGPMRRFAGNDFQAILDWIQQGAPEAGCQGGGLYPGRGGCQQPCLSESGSRSAPSPGPARADHLQQFHQAYSG